MFKNVLVAMLLVATPLAAQRGGGGGGGGGFGGGGGTAAPTPFQTFADDLGLDKKTQVPAAQELFDVAQKEAAAIAMDMVNIRQQMLNAETSGMPDELKTASAAHTADAIKMVAIETRLFAKVYALLKPDQQKKAPKAFEELAGVFHLSSSPARTGFGGRGAPGGGGARGGGQ
jgi:hypothetical protein